MNIFDQKLQWHRKFTVSNISKSHVKFVSESLSSLLDRSTYNIVNHFIKSEQTLIDYSMSVDPQLVAFLHHRVQSLLDSGYLISFGTEDETYFIPNFNAPFDGGTECGIIMLSQCKEKELVRSALGELNLTNEVNLVVVDDYLDPRLEKIDKHFKVINQPWLLLKLSGERSLIGPLFSGQIGKPCWHCLRYRMKANDVLKWVRYDNNDNLHSSISIPTLSCIKHIKQYLLDAVPLINQLITEKNNERLFELSERNDSLRLHPVIHRPQCPSCGDSQYYDKQVNREIKLSSALKKKHKDGGVRCITPQQTITKLTKLISPLSGLLTHISMLSEGTEKTNKIFRSGFYQSPMTLNFLTYQLSNSTFMHTTMGKGISTEQSKASALSEAIERLASQFQGDEPYHKSALMNEDYVSPHQLSPYSDAQYKSFSEQKNTMRNISYIP